MGEKCSTSLSWTAPTNAPRSLPLVAGGLWISTRVLYFQGTVVKVRRHLLFVTT